MISDEFVVLLQDHPNLGQLAYPYIVTNDQSGYLIKEKITLQKIAGFQLSESEANIVKITENYSDQSIFKLFSKKKQTIKVFYSKLDADYSKTYIKPYLEKQLNEIFNILYSTDIKLFERKKKDIKLYSTDQINVLKQDAKVTFNFIKTSEELKYFISILQQNNEIILNEKTGNLLVNEPCWLNMGRTLYKFSEIDGKKLLPFFNKPYISIAKEYEKKYFETFVLNSIAKYRVNNKGFDIKTIDPSKKAILSFEDNLHGDAIFILNFQYEETKFKHDSIRESHTWLEIVDSNYTFFKFKRDANWESNFIEILENSGLKLNTNNNFILKTDTEQSTEERRATIINWLNSNKKNLISAGLIVEQDFFKKKYFTESISLDLNYKSEADWFDIFGYAVFGDIKIPFHKLKKNIIKGEREYELPNGEIAILPEEWFSKYTNLFNYSSKVKDKLRLGRFHSHFIEGTAIKGNKDIINKYKLLFSNPDIKECKLPKTLKAELRPYQNKGFDWLSFLNRNQFGACLADDMGLGKTVQTIALLLANKKNDTQSIESANGSDEANLFSVNNAPDGVLSSHSTSRTSLIVMPVSLIHNWQNEIKKFAPSLKSFLFLNQNRTKNINSLALYDIVITTYGIVRNDIETLKNFNFYYIILDESQYIKNPGSKIYKAVQELNSLNKLVLTGTPIENSLTDLWAQMNFINRGILGNLKFFKEEFLKPIEKQDSLEHKQKLNKIIQPFVLRRTKAEVVKELPPVTEQTLSCSMSTEQRSYYETEKSKIRNAIMDDIGINGVNKSSIQILQALNKLRQLSIHPLLVDEDYEFDSGKFNQITQDIESVIAENHKILIFSSYVKHLSLIANYLGSKKIQYSLLTGQVQQKDREKVINNFKEESDNNVFLISLKAGGVGLNLTQADYVFIIDPWWNPAAEWQAVSRAHRIGQNKKVFVYRYISENSIEEKITKLQEKKTQLADTFINSNTPFKTLSSIDIEELFE